MLTQEMVTVIENFSAGSVATVNADGTPSVSPKATFVVLDTRTLAFGHIRSPGTITNLNRNAAIEVCFTDIVARRAVRVTGTATVVGRTDANAELEEAFRAAWGPYQSYIKAYVTISVTAAKMLHSPAYDIGWTEEKLRSANLEKLNAL